MKKLTVSVLSVLVIGGCTVGPDYKRPQTQMPASYANASTTAGPATAPTTAPTTRPVSLAQWWTTFDDPALDSLIDQAIKSYQDLRIAEARVREARALRAVAAASVMAN